MRCFRVLVAVAGVAALAPALGACGSGSAQATPSPKASAQATPSTPVVATGDVTCTDITGTVSFSPALHAGGVQPETESFLFTSTQCRTTGSNVPAVAGMTISVTTQRDANSCGGLTASHPIAATIRWQPDSIAPSTVSFTGFATVVEGPANVHFDLPLSGGRATVTGSFAGADGGAGSSVHLATPMTPSEFHAACSSAAGLSGQSLTGTLTLS